MPPFEPKTTPMCLELRAPDELVQGSDKLRKDEGFRAIVVRVTIVTDTCEAAKVGR